MDIWYPYKWIPSKRIFYSRIYIFFLCPNKKSRKLNVSQKILPWTAELFVNIDQKNIFN